MKTLLLFLLSLATVSVASAEPASVLTWVEAVQTAVDNNPELASAIKSLAASRADLKRSWNTLLPRLNLSGSYGRSKNDSPQSNRWSVGGTASVDVFNMGTYADISSANAAFDQAEASLRLAGVDVLYALRSAFIALLYVQNQVQVSRIIKDLRDTNARLVVLRYESGRESKGNMLRANAEQIQANADLAQAERDVIANQYEFVRQLGWDEPRVIIATGTLNVVDYQLEPRDVITSLVPLNPAVALAQARVRSASSSVAQARSNLWPNLSASYSRSNFGPSYFPENPTWSASGNLNFPVFNNGPLGAYYSISAAKHVREAVEQDLRATRTRVRSELETAWSTLAGAIDDIHVQEAFLLAARQRNDEADIRYSNGLMSYEDWTVIVSDRVNFERSVVNARRGGLQALAQWNNSAGIELGNEK